MQKKLEFKNFKSVEEERNYQNLLALFKNCPIPEEQIFDNLGLFLGSKQLARILFMNHLYQKIVDVQGIIIDFGTRWGQNMAIFSALRGIYEPFNRLKKIVGFDTFAGFPKITKEDGESDQMKVGNANVTRNYKDYLTGVMDYHEKSTPLGHIKKYDIVSGDASREFRKYLIKNPETIVALAYFDFDLYEPTKKCLTMIKPHLVRGSVIAFDELNDHDSPGETLAVSEVFGLNNIKLKRYPYTSRTSYFVFE